MSNLFKHFGQTPGSDPDVIPAGAVKRMQEARRRSAALAPHAYVQPAVGNGCVICGVWNDQHVVSGITRIYASSVRPGDTIKTAGGTTMIVVDGFWCSLDSFGNVIEPVGEPTHVNLADAAEDVTLGVDELVWLIRREEVAR